MFVPENFVANRDTVMSRPDASIVMFDALDITSSPSRITEPSSSAAKVTYRFPLESASRYVPDPLSAADVTTNGSPPRPPVIPRHSAYPYPRSPTPTRRASETGVPIERGAVVVVVDVVLVVVVVDVLVHSGGTVTTGIVVELVLVVLLVVLLVHSGGTVMTGIVELVLVVVCLPPRPGSLGRPPFPPLPEPPCWLTVVDSCQTFVEPSSAAANLPARAMNSTSTLTGARASRR
jgi:hypothetical protein